MGIKRRLRNSAQTESDRAALAAFLGDPCPEGFNPFKFNCFEDVLALGHRQHADVLLEAWPRLRADVLREWKRRKRQGSPPGCALDKPARR